MKKLFLFTAIILLVVVGCVSLLACNKPIKVAELKINSENLMKDAKITDVVMKEPITDEKVRAKKIKNASNLLSDNKKYWTPFKDNSYASVEIELSGKKTFNTAVVSEVGCTVGYFRLQAYVDGEWKTLQASEKMGEQRILSFDTVTTSRLRLSIEKFYGKKDYVKINYIKLYNLKSDTTNNFNVAVYQRLDTNKPTDILAKGDEYVKTYARYYDVYNTIIVFDAVNWDANGNLVFCLDGKNGTSPEECFAEQIEALKKIVAKRTNPHKVRIIVTAIADGAGGDHQGVNALMSANHTKIADKIADTFIKKYELDGVDIDWEYPQTKKDWACYDTFIKELDEKMHAINPNAIISAALSAWAIGMQKETMDIIDQIQYMAYDDFDLHGDQSTIYRAQLGLQDFVKNGADKGKINIGIPAYGRPTDGGAYWPSWSDVKNTNYFDSRYQGVNCYQQGYYRECSFCSPALAGDKTALSIFGGCGGVMVFRLNTDKLMDDTNAVACGIEHTLKRYGITW